MIRNWFQVMDKNSCKNQINKWLCQRLGIYMDGCGMIEYNVTSSSWELDWTLESFGSSTSWCTCKEGFNCLVLFTNFRGCYSIQWHVCFLHNGCRLSHDCVTIRAVLTSFKFNLTYFLKMPFDVRKVFR